MTDDYRISVRCQECGRVIECPEPTFAHQCVCGRVTGTPVISVVHSPDWLFTAPPLPESLGLQE